MGKVQHASTGQEALNKMEGFIPDLIICSMYFEDMTGTDIAKKMRDIKKLEAIPFMLISSESSWEKLDELKQLGVIAILPKPFEILDLKMALNATLAYLDPEELEFTGFNIEDTEVLLVDDSLSARRYIRRILTDMEMNNIQEAVNGKDAIAFIEKHNYDLIVTDYNMPEMDGRGLLEYIRNESAQPYVPVLMVTSETNNTRLSTIKQAGVSAICDKPFDVNHVKVLLNNILVDLQ